MSVMNVDYDKLRIILMPHVLRQGGLLEALFTAAYKPLKRCYEAFVGYEAKECQKRNYGPTVKQLKAAIADLLGIDASYVRISDIENRDVIDLRRQSDAASTRLVLCGGGLYDPADTEHEHPLPLWSDDQVWWNREFTVSLPAAYRAFEPAVKTILDRWKMAASRYTIIYR